LRNTCWESLIEQRRNNYHLLSHTAKNSNQIEPLYPQLPDGVCPLHLPVIVENREQICLRLNEMGISANQWWAGFHQAFDWREFPEAKYLKEHLLVIPIHQQLNRKQLGYINNQIENITSLSDN